MDSYSYIPKDERERQLYRDVAIAYRNARRQGGPPHVCYWAAAAVIQKKRPHYRHAGSALRDEAGRLGAKIVHTVAAEFPAWFWK